MLAAIDSILAGAAGPSAVAAAAASAALFAASAAVAAAAATAACRGEVQDAAALARSCAAAWSCSCCEWLLPAAVTASVIRAVTSASSSSTSSALSLSLSLSFFFFFFFEPPALPAMKSTSSSRFRRSSRGGASPTRTLRSSMRQMTHSTAGFPGASSAWQSSELAVHMRRNVSMHIHQRLRTTRFPRGSSTTSVAICRTHLPKSIRMDSR
mmetsp:Transcript_50216/g.143586  ORF Transcript_50216/g.143586 Transcript_50216/m.143586 type:complete len:211 (-) Transcript_50216:1354-1986(-)